MITGQYLYNAFSEQAGFPYTGYMSPPQANFLFERCFVKAMSDIFVGDKQNVTNKDSLNTLVNSNLVLSTINNNSFYVEPLSVSNMTFVGTTITVTTFLPHNLVVGNTIIITGAIFATNAPNNNGTNPTWTVTSVTNANTFVFVAAAVPTGTYTANSAILVLSGGQIYFEAKDNSTPTIFTLSSDYWRFLAIKTKYYLPVNSTPQIIKWGMPLYVISGTGNAVQIQLGFNNYSSIRTGDNIKISGITGNTNANVDCYIQMLNDLTGVLFSDRNMTTPIIGNGTFGGKGIVSRIYYNYCKPYLSDEKISPLGTPTPRNPKYELANSFIKLYPTNYTASEITIDYIRKPYPVYANLASPSYFPIETSDSTINLEDYYPSDFLFMIKDIAVNTFLSEIRDGSGIEMNSQVGV